LSTTDQRAVAQQHVVHDRGGGRDQIHSVLALEPLLHDVHVQQAQEAAPEAKAERLRYLRLEVHRRIVQLQLRQGVPQRLVLIRFDRKQAREHLRLDLLESGQCPDRGPRHVRDGVADPGVA